MGAKFTTTGATTYDLTSTSVNPNAAPVATPREGGFVLRNRIDFDEVTAPTATARVANILKILNVPKRTVVRAVRFHAIRGETAPTHAYSSASTHASSDASGATMGVGGVWYQSASQSSTTTDTDALADHALSAVSSSAGSATGGSIAGFPTLSSSAEMTDYTSQSDSASPTLPFTFPYGGYLTMGITNSTGSSASSVSGKFSGVLEVRALCDYIPE